MHGGMSCRRLISRSGENSLNRWGRPSNCLPPGPWQHRKLRLVDRNCLVWSPQRGFGKDWMPERKLGSRLGSCQVQYSYFSTNDSDVCEDGPPAKNRRRLPLSTEKSVIQFDKRAELFDTNAMSLSQSEDGKNRSEEAMSAYRIFHSMAPYIAAHYGAVVVIHIPGEVLQCGSAEEVINDIILLKTLGMKVVLVVGCRPQIRNKLEAMGIKSKNIKGNMVCDAETLFHCQSEAGFVRLYIESLLTRGLIDSPKDLGSVTATSGNFVRAVGFGVRSGVDYMHTGIVKSVNSDRIKELLDHGDVVVLGNLGVGANGTIYNCRSEDVAVQAATNLKADKIVFLHGGESIKDTRRAGDAVVHNLPVNIARKFAKRLEKQLGMSSSEAILCDKSENRWKGQFLDYLQGCIRSVENGVTRAHMVNRHVQGTLIGELCTRDGTGLLISRDLYDGMRLALVHDVPALKKLISPLEESNILVTRPPSKISEEIDSFVVFEREGAILACCRLDFYPDERYGKGAVELSCVAVAPSSRGSGIGNSLLSYCLRKSFAEGITTVFVLTTRSDGWFVDRMFREVSPDHLPPPKLAAYDYSRNSKVLFKNIKSLRSIDEEEVLWFTKS